MNDGLSVCLSVRHSDFAVHEAELQAYFQTFHGTPIQWFLVVQIDAQDEAPTFSGFFETHIIVSKTSGLSNSRNIGLENCSTKHCIFTDFDARYSAEALLGFAQFLQHEAEPVPFFLFGVQRVEGDVSASAHGVKGSFEISDIEVDYVQNATRLSQVFSVQLCWDVAFIRQNDLRFDPTLGLGSGRRRLNFGEEYLLALSCFFLARKYGVIKPVFGAVQAVSTGLGKSRLDKALLALYVVFRAQKGSKWERVNLLAAKFAGKISASI